MKKSEKIEIRLSHEDKTNLAELAKKEGHTVSELVRRIIQRYVAFNTSTVMRKFPLAKILMIAAASFLAGGFLAFGLINPSQPNEPYKSSEYWLKTIINARPMFITIPMKDGFTTDLEIPNDQGNIKINIKLDREQDNLPFLHMNFCRQMEDECQLIANPKLLINQENTSSLSFHGNEGEWIIIEIGPT